MLHCIETVDTEVSSMKYTVAIIALSRGMSIVFLGVFAILEWVTRLGAGNVNVGKVRGFEDLPISGHYEFECVCIRAVLGRSGSDDDIYGISEGEAVCDGVPSAGVCGLVCG